MTTATVRTRNSAQFVTTHSILTLDTRNAFTRRSLLDAQQMHRTVMSGFRGWVADGEPGARSSMGILSTWSVDLAAGALVLVVQSGVPADWSAIPQSALKAVPRTIMVDQTIRVGDTLRFRTVVNPTRDRSVPKKSPGPDAGKRRRSPHRTADWALTWFTDRLQGAGEPPTSSTGVKRIGATADPERLSVRLLPTALSNDQDHKGLRLTRAEIKGELTVTDPVVFVETLITGIGHGRAYSLGLILAGVGR